MSYKHRIKEIKKNREKYFPLMEYLLSIEKGADMNGLPFRIENIDQIALVLELIDIGYIRKDAFIINKNRRDITGLFFKGGYPLTEEGVGAYDQHLSEKKSYLVKLILISMLTLVIAAVLYLLAD